MYARVTRSIIKTDMAFVYLQQNQWLTFTFDSQRRPFCSQVLHSCKAEIIFYTLMCKLDYHWCMCIIVPSYNIISAIKMALNIVFRQCWVVWTHAREKPAKRFNYFMICFAVRYQNWTSVTNMLSALLADWIVATFHPRSQCDDRSCLGGSTANMAYNLYSTQMADGWKQVWGLNFWKRVSCLFEPEW